jgi:hypothetical protein
VNIDQNKINKIKEDPSDLAEIEKELTNLLENIHQYFKNKTF